MVEEDVRTGMARPSLVAEVKAVMLGTEVPALLPDLTLDALFMAPERRLTEIQRRLLQSVELQKRTIQFSRRNATKKSAKQGLLKYLQRSLRRLPRLGFHAAYLLYSMTLRPSVKRIRKQLNTRP
jgi:hypothetical protein